MGWERRKEAMDLKEFPNSNKYREQTDIVKIHTQKYFIVLNAKDIFCRHMQARLHFFHIERLLARN